ncbi:DUF3047 domain-containing protein [Inhella gelatinilytica]|uniref:DUF3047 domain-containing protein n=1 Tax=Inhella gelatinilytica TaxID=2795030 RepID=A0A931ND42_9BURK|nr:DUF3047 domain-containing protein [Inhella gelatinilytica]MBH9552692.1 DUF3047 domain-containing protein [Inhella gelatinilytica]
MKSVNLFGSLSLAPGLTRRSALALGAALTGCATPAPPAKEAEGWQEVPLPGKRRNQYRRVQKEGRVAWEAQSERAASLWRRPVAETEAHPTWVSFSWWVDRLLPASDVRESDREDAVARVILGFDGDRDRLSARNRGLFDLAELLTGEAPPFATLMYVWDREAPLDSVVVNGRSDRIRKIVVDSGSAQLGRWRDHRRDVVTDFERAYGEAPGPLRFVAVMSDSDNTQGRVRAWYGPVRWGV